MQAEMLPYMTSTNPYYFPAVIVPVLVLRLYQPRSASPCSQWHPVYKDTFTCYLPRLEVHSTRNYHNCFLLASIFSDPGDPSLVVCKSGGRRPGESYHIICGMTVICHHIYPLNSQVIYKTNLTFCASYKDGTSASRASPISILLIYGQYIL